MSRSTRKKDTNSNTKFIVLGSACFFAMIYPETRLTILLIPLTLSVLLVLENKMFMEKDKTTPKRLILPMLALLLITLFYSDHRIRGFAIPRKMIYYTLNYEPNAAVSYTHLTLPTNREV